MSARPPIEPSVGPEVKERAAADQLRLLFSKGLLVYPTSVINACLYAALVARHVSSTRSIVWLTIIACGAALRIGLRQMYWRVPRGAADTRRWQHLSVAGAATYGLAWGASAFLAYPHGWPTGELLQAITLAGCLGVASSLSASHLPTYFAFAVTAVGPTILELTAHPDWFHRLLGLMLLFFTAQMGSIALATGRALRESALLRFQVASQNETLARRAEEQEELAGLLRRTEKRLRIIMQAVNVGVWYSDYPFSRVVISPGIKDYAGLPDAEVSTEAFISANHPDDRESVRQAVARCIEKGEEYDIECRTVRATDGRLRWVRNVGRCFRDSEGKPYHFDGVTYDITERKEKEAERERLLGELSEANLLRERLLGIVSHDLKSPLTSLTMTASLLDGEVTGEGAKKIGERILRSAERMKRLICQLLDFASIRAKGGLPVETTPVDLHALCRHAIDELAVAHPRNTISFEATGDCSGAWDGDRLAQVLANLLGNAIQHGGGSPITVRIVDEKANVAIRVHNEGKPIPPDLLPFIFDPFRQGEELGKTQSLSVGLGLHIVQQIVLAHGGQIEVDSRDGEGTTFTIHLPRHPTVSTSRGKETVATPLHH
jgi:PAS domain S-box-containing protein